MIPDASTTSGLKSPGDGPPRRAPLALLVSTVASLLAGWLLPANALAENYRVRTYSLGRATQTFQPDRTAATRRVYTQGLDLRAYDLLGDRSGRLDAALGARYTTDFMTPQNRRDDPIYANRWNHFALQLAYLDWRAAPGVHLRLGRQWSRGSLGVRDFDGLRAELNPRLDTATRGLLGVYAGRDVELGTASYNSDTFDVQGLPSSNADDVDPIGPAPDHRSWIAGGRIGLEWERSASLEFAYRKRWRTRAGEPVLTSSDARTGSERFGFGASATPQRRVTVSSSAAYHTLLERIDQAGLDVAWDVPGPLGTVSTGLEHRHPWFDSSSIFNLFGTRPHQGGHATYQHGVRPLRTEFELRSWGRVYRGDPGSTGLRQTDRKTTRVGGAVAHYSDLRPWGRPLDWSSQFSLEADTAGEESTHLLADSRGETPFVFDDLYLTGRVLFLGTTAKNALARSGLAITYVLGLDVPISEFGTFSLMAERTVATYHPSTTNLFGTLELEFWR